jgi:hypothetical protein
MIYLSQTIFVYWFYKILVIEPTTEVKAESIGAPSVKEIAFPGKVKQTFRVVIYHTKYTLLEKYG